METDPASGYDKIIDWGFLLLFFLLPLIISPWNYSIFALPQVTFLRFSTLLIAAAWLLKMVRTGEFMLLRSPLNLALLSFLAIAAVSTLLSPYRTVSFYGRVEDYQGFLSLANYVLICFLALNLIKKERLHAMIGALMLSTSVIALYGISQHFGLDFMRLKAPDLRSWSTLGNPIFLGGHLVLVLPLSVAHLIYRGKNRFLHWLALATIVVSLPALLFTLTRAAWLGFAMGLLLLIALSWREIFGRPQILLWLAIPLVASFLAILVDVQANGSWSLSERALSIFSLSREGGRLGLWGSVLPLLVIRPLFGWGPGSFHVLTSLGGSGGTHNELLNLSATVGFLGLIAYLTTVAIFFSVAIKGLRRIDNHGLRAINMGLIAGVFAYLVHLQFSFSFASTGSLFWLLMGLAVGPALGEQRISLELFSKAWTDSLSVRRMLAAGAISALVLLTFVISKPLIADLHFKRALDLEGGGSLEQAIEEYERAVVLDPTDEFYLTMLGRAYLAQAVQTVDFRQYYLEKAMGVSNRALHLNPNSIDAHLNLGITYAYGGSLARAVGEWEKVVNFKADHADAHRFLARAYEKMGKLEAARANYEKVLGSDPDNAEAREALVRLGQ